MARKDTLLNTGLTNSVVKPENIATEQPTPEKAELQEESPVRKAVNRKRSTPTTQQPKHRVKKRFVQESNNDDKVSRTVTINKVISDLLDDYLSDPNEKSGKAKGSYGFISKVINNGLIRELVEREIIDSSFLDQIEP